MLSADRGVLHVTNGDAAVPTLRAHGIEGPILPWRDLLHEGPVPAVEPSRLRELRAAFLSGESGRPYDDVLADLKACWRPPSGPPSSLSRRPTSATATCPG